MVATREIDVVERRARLAIRHRLIPSRRTDDIAQIADDIVALHSSDPATVYLSAMARMLHPSLQAVDQALYEQRSVIRHHAMRRTLWVMTPQVAGLAHWSSTLPLVGPEQRRLIKLLEASGATGDGERWLDEARRDVLAALNGLGQATTRQLGDLVPALRIPLEVAVDKKYNTTLIAHTRVLLLLGFLGEIVRVKPSGSWVNGQYPWTAMDSWINGGLAPIELDIASAGLVHRWLHAFGPAPTTDLQWWTGWSGAQTKRALDAANAVAVSIDGQPGWLAADDGERIMTDEPWVALLPGLDPTTMGWKSRDWYLDPANVNQLFDRNGNAGPSIWVDGRIVGGWVQRGDRSIAVQMFTDIGRQPLHEIEAVAHRLEQLVGAKNFTVRFPAPMQKALLASTLPGTMAK